MRIFALIALSFLLFSCASVERSGKQKYRDDGLPVWVESSFTNPSDFWAGFNDEKGFYSWGSAKYADAHTSTTAAELDAKSRLVEFVRFERGVKENEGVSVIQGMRRVDRFVSDDGTVYVLMFVSEKNAKKIFRR